MRPSSSASPDLYLPVAGALLRYRDEGCGPAVLLIHGWTLDLDMWEPQIAALRSSFRLIRFDRRGFGLSSGRPSLPVDVQDALSLCDQLQLKRFACVGMSQGARVALHLCRIAPQRLSCVVLDGPPRTLAEDVVDKAANEAAGHATDEAMDEAMHKAMDDDSAADEPEDASEDIPLAEYRRLIARGDIAIFRRSWASHPLMQLETRSAHPRALLERMTARYSGDDLLQELSAPEEHWDRTITASLRTPALILTGEHDLPARVRAANALAATLPFSQRASISAARHLPNLDNPQSYNAVLRAFLERHAGSCH